ncbi:glycosyltransferase family 39 protein [Variovorax sp. J22R133]|uniref:ArnT family glycosyltransferase n=1 Tax=Variovorax brevis TaxID=3053503 RepID=UPI0025789DB6|nr:glycosyltransferase family 39 protein [Variovorax sp. J22R133]MDM0113951.1 glycosyltransferase family 39 protein [Variovorax sp. J22R133]
MNYHTTSPSPRLSTAPSIPRTAGPAILAYSGIVLLWLVMLVISDPWGSYPLNDDWVYSLAVKSLLESGVYHFPSPSSANVGPQVFWGALFCLPFGFSFEALRISTSVLGLIGALVLFRTLETLTDDWKRSLFGTLALLVNPLYFGLSSTYMTDVPFVACSIVAIHFFVLGFRRQSSKHLLIAIGVSMLVILIRQLGICLLIGFAVAHVVQEKFSMRSVVKGLVVVGLGAALHLGYQYWMVHTGRISLAATHSDVSKFAPSWHDGVAALGTSAKIVSYLGLFFLPLAALFSFRPRRPELERYEKKLFVALGIFGLVLTALLFLTGKTIPSLGNVLMPFGLGPLTLRDTYLLSINLPVIPRVLQLAWQAMTILSVMAVTVALYFLATRFARGANSQKHSAWWHNPLLSFLLGTAGSYFLVLLYAAGHFPIFDRYLLFFLPLLMVALFSADRASLPAMRGARLVTSAFCMLAMAVFSVAATHDYVAWGKTRWQATEELVRSDKIDPRQIDGGYEFNGWYIYDAGYVPTPGKSYWWVVNDAYVIASGPMAGYDEIKRHAYDRWLLGETAHVLVLKKAAP